MHACLWINYGTGIYWCIYAQIVVINTFMNQMGWGRGRGCRLLGIFRFMGSFLQHTFNYPCNYIRNLLTSLQCFVIPGGATVANQRTNASGYGASGARSEWIRFHVVHLNKLVWPVNWPVGVRCWYPEYKPIDYLCLCARNYYVAIADAATAAALKMHFSKISKWVRFKIVCV